jgi:hypothetical protein
MSISCCDSARDELVHVHEEDLPACVRPVLDAARAARLDDDVECVEFHTREGGRVVTHMGSDTGVIFAGDGCATSRLGAKDLLVLSVAVTETTLSAVHTVTHVLIARIRARRRNQS